MFSLWRSKKEQQRHDFKTLEKKFNDRMVRFFAIDNKMFLNHRYHIPLTLEERMTLGVELTVSAVELDILSQKDSILQRFYLVGTDLQLPFRTNAQLEKFLCNLDVLLNKINLY